MRESDCHEIALIERLLLGKDVKESSRNSQLVRRYAAAGWLSPSPRRRGWQVVPTAKQDITGRLKHLWPTREQDLPLLASAALSPERPAALLHLPTLRRSTDLMRKYINHHTWSTLFGAGPKRSAWRNPGPDVVLTHDAHTRLRPNKGLTYARDDVVLQLDQLVFVLSEFGVPQRSILAGGRFAGKLPRLLITIENLGAFIDARVPDDVMLVYSPGFDLRAAEQVLRMLADIPWVHFGDLDPEGLQIWESLKKSAQRSCQLYIPTFAEEYVDIAQKPDVPWGEAPPHAVFEALRDAWRGLYQEAFVLDPRLEDDLAERVKNLDCQEV